MRTVKTLKPGRKGARELLLRYRYGEERREHLKAVELVVRRRAREREAESPGSRSAGGLIGGASSRRVAAEHLGLRARMVGRSGAWIDVDAAAGSEMSRFRPRFLDLGTVKVRGSYMWTPVPRSGNLGSAGYEVPRSRNLGWGRGV